MGFLDALLGRSRPVRSRLERLMSISTAALTFATAHDLESDGRAGICFRSLSSHQFRQLEQELRDLLQVSGKETESQVVLQEDAFGYHWVIVADPELEDLVTTIHMVSITLAEEGFRDQLLAAVFRFHDAEGHTVYWIYNYKRGSFYPFVPSGARTRATALELRLHAIADGELPLEAEQAKWYPLWDLPV